MLNFYCPLCRDSIIITSRLCAECDSVSKLYVLYGKETLLKAINKCFLVNEKGQRHKLIQAEKEVKGKDNVFSETT